jgi:heme/copper-type cytochrome/quinol oxidase subunit 2
MPIMVHAVSPEEFTSWLASAKEEFASNKDEQFVLQ